MTDRPCPKNRLETIADAMPKRRSASSCPRSSVGGAVILTTGDENSPRPTRRRERKKQRVKLIGRAQSSVFGHALIYSDFRSWHHRTPAGAYQAVRIEVPKISATGNMCSLQRRSSKDTSVFLQKRGSWRVNVPIPPDADGSVGVCREDRVQDGTVLTGRDRRHRHCASAVAAGLYGRDAHAQKGSLLRRSQEARAHKHLCVGRVLALGMV